MFIRGDSKMIFSMENSDTKDKTEKFMTDNGFKARDMVLEFVSGLMAPFIKATILMGNDTERARLHIPLEKFMMANGLKVKNMVKVPSNQRKETSLGYGKMGILFLFKQNDKFIFSF